MNEGEGGSEIVARKDSFLKNCAFTALTFLVFLSCLEFFAAVVLFKFFSGEENVKNLLTRFPAQLRMSGDKISESFMDRTLIEKTNFDPAMGFRTEKFLVKLGSENPDLTICALGGSTTAGDNWPVYMEKYAELENVREKITVVNAGVPGYMSTNQQDYLTNWVMGLNNINCDVVLSLDGVNDIHFRVAAYLYALKSETRWIPGYHGYQQKLDHDIRKMTEGATPLRMALGAFVENVRSGKSSLSRVMPYSTMLVIRRLNAKNQRAGSQKVIRILKEKNLLHGDLAELPKDVQFEILRAYRNSILDLAGACDIRGVPFISYLQPIHLDRYCSCTKPRVNAAQDVQKKIGHQLSLDIGVDVKRMYEETEKLYQGLEEEHPENFGNLIYLLKGIDEELYVDTVHYTREGKELIAQAMIKDLLSRNILHEKESGR